MATAFSGTHENTRGNQTLKNESEVIDTRVLNKWSVYHRILITMWMDGWENGY